MRENRPLTGFAAAGLCGALLLLQPGALHAEPCASGSEPLSGRVLDEATQVPLVGAAVSATYRLDGERRDRTLNAETEAGGVFHFCDVPPGTRVRVQAKYELASSAQLEATVGADTLRIALAVPGSVITGRIVEGGSGSGVGNAAVRLGGTRLEALSASDGRFRFARVPPGRYELNVEHLGFLSVQDSVEVESSSTTDIAVTLSVEAVPLEPLQVTTRSFHLDRVGFYNRRERLAGSFLTRTELGNRPASYASDLLRGMAGIRLAPRRNSYGSMPVGRGNCGFRYIVDGARIGPGFEIDDVRPDWIEAIEVYRGASEVPGEFSGPPTDPRANCGLIVVWTRVR